MDTRKINKNLLNLSKVTEEAITSFLTPNDYLALSLTSKKIYGAVDCNSRQNARRFYEANMREAKVAIDDGCCDDDNCCGECDVAYGVITAITTPVIALLMYIGYGARDLVRYAAEEKKSSFVSDPQSIMFKRLSIRSLPLCEKPIEHLGFSSYIP